MNSHCKAMLAAVVTLSIALSGVIACGSKKSGKSDDTKGGDTAGMTGGMSGATKARARVSAKARPKVVPLKEFSLESSDPIWKGWTATGPNNAKVMKDGYKGSRLAADGPGMMNRKPGGDQGFDIAFKQSKKPLKGFQKVKKSLDRKVKYSKGKMKYTILKEEPGLITWTQERGQSKSYHLQVHLKVGGKHVLCRSNQMIGAGNAAELARYLAGCRSLKKK